MFFMGRYYPSSVITSGVPRSIKWSTGDDACTAIHDAPTSPSDVGSSQFSSLVFLDTWTHKVLVFCRLVSIVSALSVSVIVWIRALVFLTILFSVSSPFLPDSFNSPALITFDSAVCFYQLKTFLFEALGAVWTGFSSNSAAVFSSSAVSIFRHLSLTAATGSTFESLFISSTTWFT